MLVRARGRDIEDAATAVGGRPARALDQERHRGGLVDQPEPAIPVPLAGVGGVEIDATAQEDAVDLGHQRPVPARVEVAPERTRRPCEAVVDIGADGLLPVPVVRAVDRVFGGRWGDPQVRPGQPEGAGVAVQREEVDGPARGQDEGRAWPVEDVARRALRGPGGPGKPASLARGPGRRVWNEREDRADRHVEVDVARAVDRIDREPEAAVGVEGLDLLPFLGDQSRHRAPAQGRAEQGVGPDVHHLLAVAACIGPAFAPEVAGDGAQGDEVGDIGADRGHDPGHGRHGARQRTGFDRLVQVLLQGRSHAHDAPLPRFRGCPRILVSPEGTSLTEFKP